MNKLAAATILVLSLAGPAGAQEWSGWYGGFSAGVLGGGYSDEYGTTVSNLGASAGAFGGYRTPVNSAVVGIELGGQVSAGKADGLQRIGLPDGNYQSVGRISTRAVVGLPMGKALPYAAVGAAVNFQHYTPFAGRNTVVAHPSLEVAAGLDYALTDTVVGRFEVNYSALNAKNYDVGFGPCTYRPTAL